MTLREGKGEKAEVKGKPGISYRNNMALSRTIITAMAGTGHPDSGVSKPTAAFAVHTLAGVKEAMGDAVAVAK